MGSAQIVHAIDVQVTGETGRVLFDRDLVVKGRDMAAKLQYCRANLDYLRHAVLREPRGHANLMGAIVVPGVNDDSDFGVIIMEQADFAPMSGANLMCAITAVLEMEEAVISEPITKLRVDTAAGVVNVVAHINQGRATKIEIDNVPSFALHVAEPLVVPEFGEIPVDISFGGQFYVQAPAEVFGLKLEKSDGPKLIRAANQMLAAAREHFSVVHPTQPHMNRIDLPMLYGEGGEVDIDGRGTVVMPTQQPSLTDPVTWDAGTLDRSPGGTGTCARMAVEYAKGHLQLGEEFVQQSLLGTTFTGRLDREFEDHGQTMLKPTLMGRGWIVGHHQLIIEDDDPFPTGYVL